jgi:hypothetical protein
MSILAGQIIQISKYSTMKKHVLLIALFMSAYVVSAQTTDDYIELSRDILKTEKKAAIAGELDLTNEEITPFWELYNEFNNKMSQVQNKRIALIKDFAQNYESLSGEKADEIMKAYFAYQQELLKLKKMYYGKFKRILPKDKAARYFQLENKVQAIVDAELAAQIPLIETD